MKMKSFVNPYTKIGIFLVLIILLPTLFFSVYEIGNMTQNEQVIDSTYMNQLESVIFSINQYSDDVISRWAGQLDNILQGKPENRKSQIEKLLHQNYAIDLIFIADSVQSKQFYWKDTIVDSLGVYQAKVDKLITANKKVIARLKQYIQDDYRKIQPVQTVWTNQTVFLFIVKGEQFDNVCLLSVNSENFIKENLGQKIQSIARNKFFISVFDSINGDEVYSSDILDNSQKDFEHKQAFWLIPGYQLGIQLKGQSIEELVRQRTNTNILLILLMDVFLLLGAWLVYRSIRQEVKLAQIKSEFVSNVSHEIRTPLALINMYSETLEMGRIQSEEKKMEYYKVIHNESSRLSQMVNKILNFSKIESGKKEYNFEEEDLNTIVNDTLEMYRPHFERRKFIFEFKPEKGKLLVLTDKEAVTEALNNLIDNAMKYSGELKKIEVLTKTSQQEAIVDVKDFGIGIEIKDQKLIFDKFYRVTKGDLAHKAKGSGIGLSIVKNIMEAHSGKVSLSSTPGKGSIFSLHFPLIK
ncbi:HAMP domain-containing histidine kinase [bacterium]|nr:HAMP domain-containing histidine kinase [bacterium]